MGHRHGAGKVAARGAHDKRAEGRDDNPVADAVPFDAVGHGRGQPAVIDPQRLEFNIVERAAAEHLEQFIKRRDGVLLLDSHHPQLGQRQVGDPADPVAGAVHRVIVHDDRHAVGA
ncbi:MAG TPA: hypothetical protein PKW35_15925 [Nannocystaceae bacterium]|nr:hypothetical protein [Nannocystaceae bacterium]